MNGDLMKVLVAGVVGAHGVGHLLGWLPAWGIARFDPGLSSRSWLLTDALGDGVTRALGGTLWLVPTVGFVIAAGALLTGQAAWRPLALGSAVLSFVAVVLFPEALPAGSRIGAIGVDLAVLCGLLVASWQPA